MLVSEYIVSFFIEQGITDVYGYPGGMVTYLMEALSKRAPEICAHVCHHEQGAAFAAEGYARVKKIPGAAYATSGPGATNLLTGVADAYFDSIPCVFITGQVNVGELEHDPTVRQNGFQEMDIVSVASAITKYAVQIRRAEDVPAALDRAFHLAMEGRKGPVLLDIPMNVQRSELAENIIPVKQHQTESRSGAQKVGQEIWRYIEKAERPLLLLGAGIRQSDVLIEARKLAAALKIPVVTSMVAVDVLETDSPYNLGFIGAYGHRWANIATAKADLILSLGSRLDGRQTGSNRSQFALNAKIIRVDIDGAELLKQFHEDDINYQADIKTVVPTLRELAEQIPYNRSRWLTLCQSIRQELMELDREPENLMLKAISRLIPKTAVVTADVGQHQVWAAQSFHIKQQQLLFSGGHGAMGFSLPAAIGACHASGRKPVYCITGDGGLQMNIQELQTIKREQLPIKILLFNNHSLGMIRHFQEMYFFSNFAQTTAANGYTTPDFCKVAEAYGIRAKIVTNIEDIGDAFYDDHPVLYNVLCRDTTYIYPKLAIHKPIYDQDKLMDRNLLQKLMIMEE